MSPSPALVREIRQLLHSAEFPREDARKAAVREALRAAVTGLKEEQIVAFVADLRQRFPDRVYEATAASNRFERSVEELGREVAQLRAGREQLEQRVQAQAVLIGRICTAVRELGRREASGRADVAASAPVELPDPESLGPLMEAAALLFDFAAAQDESARELDAGLGRSGRSRGAPVTELLGRLLVAKGDGVAELAELKRRFRALKDLPLVLMTTTEQSWRSGTQELLQALDPKAIEERVDTRVPGLREVAAFREIRRRHEQFWGQLENNLDHYYRAKFKRIYTERMEGGS